MRTIGLKKWALAHYNQLGYAYIFLFSVAIIFRPYTAPGQLLIIDSNLYLEIASYVIDGSFWNKFFNGAPSLYWFWPMGYPLLLGLIGKGFGGDLFLAGRFLNLLAYLITVYSIKRIFQEKWSFYVFLIGTASFLGLFTHTLTEAVFIALGFLGLSQILKEKGQVWIVVLSFSFMVLFRYIGVFSILFIGIYYVIVRKRKWFLAVVALTFLVFGYILTEWFLIHELPTSIIDPAQVDKLTLLGQTLIAMFGYFSYFEIDHWGGSWGKFLFFIGLIPFVYVVWTWMKNVKKTRILDIKGKALVFLLFGSSYLLLFFFVLFGLGWDHEGWGIQSRYVAPGMLFVIMGWFEWVKFNSEDFQKIKLVISAASAVVLIYTGFLQSLIDHLKANGTVL